MQLQLQTLRSVGSYRNVVMNDVMILKSAIVECLKVTIVFLYSPDVTISQAERLTVWFDFSVEQQLLCQNLRLGMLATLQLWSSRNCYGKLNFCW